MDFSLPQSEHLKQGEDFKRVMRGGSRVRVDLVELYISPSQGALSRLGFVVGKRAGNAPRRNFIKRMWKEAFRLERNNFTLPHDLVIRALPKYIPEGLVSLRKHIQDLNL